MSQGSSIEWTDATWNPVRGCTKISSGCAHCYAETFAERFRGVPGHPYEQGFDLRLVPEKLRDPLKWSRPSRIFVNSMSDLFHEGVPVEYIVRVAQVMVEADWHIYQVLTKRSERLLDGLHRDLEFAASTAHIWWGVSVENRRQGLPRIEHLRAAPARVRFLSIEPLLEDLGELDLTGIHWVIVGGESGHGARPMREEWVLSIRDQCALAGVPFFFKQWGGRQKSRNGRTLQGRTWDEIPVIRAVGDIIVLRKDALMKQTFTARVWQEEGWFIAQCAQVDVASQGRTQEEALSNLREALELYFEPPAATIVPKVASIEVEVGAA